MKNRRKTSALSALFSAVGAAMMTAGTVWGQSLPPHPSYQQPQPFYAADAAASADLESRISALESELKKKQDKKDPKKGFTANLDGRVYLESYHISGDSSSPLAALNTDNDYNGIKDLRIGLRGEGYDIFDYQVQFFFGNANTVEVRDVWLGVKNVPLLEYVKIGHYRVEDGIANLTGNHNINFLEFDGRDFATGRRIGVSTQHLWAQERLRIFAGLYEAKNVVQSNRNETVNGVGNDWGTITNLRITYAPYISRGKDGKYNGKNFLLFGGNYSYFDTARTGGVHADGDFQQRYATLNPAFQNYASTLGATNSYQQFGLEFALQKGPFAVQSETYARVFNNVAQHDPTVWGTYAQVRYFLSGDYRKFTPSSATWGGVDLKHNLDLQKINDHNLVKWLGALEVAAKWSYTDTSHIDPARTPPPGETDPDKVFTGSVNDITLGLNWYWNPQTRLMFDYIHVMPSHRTTAGRDHSDIDIFATSFRYHF
ncbi:MAG: hypothetical protein LBH00_07120 [Planctomycetaceae bacterium]|jgi:phosphate-selective porin OprO/OprP|nr:hypothetical protein [Planctomycetaceae bacterium]